MSNALLSRPVVDALSEALKAQFEALKASGTNARVVVVLATEDAGAVAYARAKERTAAKVGVSLEVRELPAATTQADLNAVMTALSQDASVHGVLVEMPLRAGLDADACMALLDARKDIDGLSEANIAKIAIGSEGNAILPATPQACIMLAESQVSLDGCLAAVVGRGKTVGRPLAMMLTNRNATVVHCHSRTKNLGELTQRCDIVFSATGRYGLIGAEHVRAGQVVIDAGISFLDGKIKGDVDAEAVGPIVTAYTPVPGGVGPLTSILLFKNLLKAIELQSQDRK